LRECGAADAIFTEGVEKPSSVGQRACRINPDRRDFERLHHAAESAFAAPDVECAPKAAPTDPFDHRSVEHETAAKVGVSAERSDPRLGRVVPRGGDARAVLRREAVSRCLIPTAADPLRERQKRALVNIIDGLQTVGAELKDNRIVDCSCEHGSILVRKAPLA